MKIFISYGHNDYTELVDRLFDALTAAGHQPWKDDRYEGSSGIAPGQDFTEVIYKAIDDADFVIAFVTRCTQEKFYCRDERQYAYNKKGARFIQIRMDNVEITLGNARSYIDMSDVVDTTGKIHEKLFENSLKAIFAAFRDPVSFAEGGITPWTKIDTHLKVPGSLKYHDFIATLDTGDFVGRQWLINKCKEWAQDATIARRLFVIFGEAGTGKTAFIRHLSRDEELVRSVHVCVYDRPSTRTVRDTLKDLAYVLAHKCETYYHFLKMENLEKLKDMTEDAMFEYLFLEPLKTVEEKYLLIIDGLDELEEAAGLRPLIRIFRQYADRINPNISFLITTRPDETITDLLKTVGKGDALKSVALSKDTNREDLLLYIDQKLRELDRYDTGLAQKILEACDGNFEYLSLLFKEAAEEGLPVSEEMPLPRGLNERYIQYLDRHMETRGISKISKMQRQLLALLCTIREPLPLSLLADITDTDEYDVLDELEVFGSLIHRSEESDPRISLFTKGFRDFLLSRDCRRYSADSRAGTELLAQYMMENIRQERDLTKRPYLDRNGFVHLLQYAAEEPEEVSGYIKRLAEKDVDIAKRIADAMCIETETSVAPYFALQDSLGVQYDVLTHLQNRRSAGPLYEISRMEKASGSELVALKLQADILLWDPTPEKVQRAELLYIEALEHAEKVYQKQPSFAGGHALTNICIQLGTLERKKHTVGSAAKAKQRFSKAVTFAEQNHQMYPGFKSRKDLSIASSCLGDLVWKEDRAEALQWFRKALELDEQNYRQFPSYSSRLSLSVAYYHHGKLVIQENTPEAWAEGERWFAKAREIAAENYQKQPAYHSRLDLAILYVSFGRLALQIKVPSSLHHAFRWFYEAHQLYEMNYREHPSYTTRRDLSVSCERLSDIGISGGLSMCVIPLAELFETKVRLSEQNYSEYPCFESRRDLSSAYTRQGYYYLKQPTAIHYGKAETLFNMALALDKLNHQENACFESRKELSATYSILGLLTQMKKAESSMNLAEDYLLKAMALDNENHSVNPCHESRQRLSAAYQKLASLGRKINTPESVAQAEKWETLQKELAE